MFLLLLFFLTQLTTADPEDRDLLPSLEQLKEFNAKRRIKGAVQAVSSSFNLIQFQCIRFIHFLVLLID